MTGREMLPWLIPGTLGLTWVLFAMGNACSLIGAWRRGESTSLSLFIGGIFGAIAVISAPIEGTAMWFWVPMLLDVGCLPAALAMLLGKNPRKSV